MDENGRDFVNEFFRAHYPPDFDNCEPEGCGHGWERRYQGGSTATIFPLMKLADGLEISAQGHFGAYSYPRGDFESEYLQVEIMGPPGIPELADYERECNATGERMIYPYVPVNAVNTMIEGRGGMAIDPRDDPGHPEHDVVCGWCGVDHPERSNP